MPSLKEIRRRMDAVSDTQKITKAMYLIASVKLRKAKENLEKTKPYFEAVQREMKRIFRTDSDIFSLYLYPKVGRTKLEGTYGLLVITADKGLAGAYNQNILKKAHALLNEHPDYKLFVVGEYGRQYFTNHNIPIEKSFLYTAQNPTFERAREITTVLLSHYDTMEIKKLFILYTDMKKADSMPEVNRILPFHRADFAHHEGEKDLEEPFQFYPSLEVVLKNAVSGYVAGYIYSALIDSFCCEQSARLNAMNSANKNAQGILDDLKKEYNHIRQGTITQEITEITAGANYQRSKMEEGAINYGN